MSENVIIILITTLGPIILALIGLRSIKLQKENNKITKDAIDDNTKLTNEVKETLGVVKVQTDGMKSELVNVTGLLGEAVGKAAGKAEQKAESDADRNRGKNK